MWASSSFIAKNRAGILGVSRLPQTIFLMACSADPWRTTDGLHFGTSPVSRQTNEALRPSDGNPEVIGWSVGLVLTDALLGSKREHSQFDRETMSTNKIVCQLCARIRPGNAASEQNHD